MAHITLVTGPSRSGKSEWAENLAGREGKTVTYIATGRENPNDADWQARIQRHRDRRPADWLTEVVHKQLTPTLANLEGASVGLVDSLGGWVANTLDCNEQQWHTMQGELVETLPKLPATIIFVAEETGWGVIPPYPMGRLFRDRLGALIRHLGRIADQTYLVAGGHALDLSHWGEPLP